MNLLDVFDAVVSLALSITAFVWLVNDRATPPIRIVAFIACIALASATSGRVLRHKLEARVDALEKRITQMEAGR